MSVLVYSDTLPPANVIQGHIATTKEMKCIIAMFDQNGDSEFNLVRFNIDISVLSA
jgi:hypothetical protein